MSNLIYDGPVSVYDKKADGSLLIIGKGDRQGEQYYKISFKVGGEYVNLMDFQGITGGQAGNYHVEYYQKFDPKTGEPELYNGKPQYNMESIVGGAQTPQNAAPSTQGSVAPTPSGFEQDRNESIRRQTCIKAAAVQYAAYLGADKSRTWDFEEFERIFTGTHAILDGKNELDQALDAAKKTLADEVVEMPGPDAAPDEFEGVF